MKTFTPQEIEVWYVMPAIRRALVKEMAHQKMRQNAIAFAVGLTESAVSQYLSAKRGSDLEFPIEIKAAIKKSAKIIVEKNDPQAASREIQRITQQIYESHAICKMHVAHDKSVPKSCDICFETG